MCNDSHVSIKMVGYIWARVCGCWEFSVLEEESGRWGQVLQCDMSIRRLTRHGPSPANLVSPRDIPCDQSRQCAAGLTSPTPVLSRIGSTLRRGANFLQSEAGNGTGELRKVVFGVRRDFDGETTRLRTHSENRLSTFSSGFPPRELYAFQRFSMILRNLGSCSTI